MTPAELDQELRTTLLWLSLISTAPVARLDPSGGGDGGDGAPAGSSRTPADHYRVRLHGVDAGLRRRLDAAEATGDTGQRHAEERKAYRVAHEQREQILADAQREWRALTGRDGEAPAQRTADMDTPGGIDKAIDEEAPGKPADEVAAKLGLTVFRVRRRYVALGLYPVTGEPLPSAGEDRAARVRELAARDLSERQIAMLTGLNTTQVRRALGRAA